MTYGPLGTAPGMGPSARVGTVATPAAKAVAHAIRREPTLIAPPHADAAWTFFGRGGARPGRGTLRARCPSVGNGVLHTKIPGIHTDFPRPRAKEPADEAPA